MPCVVAIIVGASAGTAAADSTDEPGLVIIPMECVEFLPTQDLSPATYWNHRISFAGCIEDRSILEVSEVDDVVPMVHALAMAIAPTMLIHRDTLIEGPRDAKLRAAYHIGLASMSLITRARASLVARDDTHRRALLAEVDRALTTTRQMAWLAFAAIENEVAEDPALVGDPVAAYMVRSAHDMLRSLPRPELANHRNDLASGR